MEVTVQQIQMGVMHYIEQEIAQKAIGVKKFAIYFIMPHLTTKITTLIDQYRQSEMFATFFNESGNIHLDELYRAAKDAIKKSGQVEYAGIIFNETDVDKLYSYIKNTVQGG